MKQIILVVSCFLLLLVNCNLSIAGDILLDLSKDIIEIESKMEERLQASLNEMLGNNKAVVIIKIDSEVAAAGKSKKSGKTEEKFILPGVPEEERLEDKVSKSRNMFANKKIIKKIRVIVFLDKGVSSKTEKIVGEIALKLLRIEVGRGDQLLIKRVKLPSAPGEFKSLFQSFLLYSKVLWLLLLLLFIIFLFGPLRGFFKKLITVFQGTKAEGASTIFRNHNSEMGEIPAQFPTELSFNEQKQLESKAVSSGKFSFINESNMRNLIYLIGNESPETIAIIVNYLNEKMASHVISSLNKALQAKVAMHIASLEQVQPEKVEKVEKEIKNKIDYLLGGEDRFLEILEYADKNTQQNIIDTLNKEKPEIGKKIKGTVIRFEDIAKLDNRSLKIILRSVPPVSLSIALRDVPEKVKMKVFDNLTPGVLERVQQEIEMGEEVSRKRIEEEHHKIVRLIHHSQEKGRIKVIHEEEGGEKMKEEKKEKKEEKK